MSVDRSQLRFRELPSMTLSNGADTSKTPPLRSLSSDVAPADRARARFAVTGNAIVTGGAGGIGSVVCRALLEHGLRGLAIFDLHPDEAQVVVDALRVEFPGATIEFVHVDVTDTASVAQAVARAEQTLGPINLCLCFAGIAMAMHAVDITLAQWKRMFDVNTTGAFLVAQTVAKAMIARGAAGGSIILMASISAHVVNFPQPQVHYNAAKAAVLAMKSSLAAEWAVHGIRVNSISPGYMDTILNEGAGLEQHRQVWAARTPFGRMGQPEELTGAVILLASKAGNYITGADILVDGGISVF